MIRLFTVKACGHCGQPIGNGAYIGLNGEYLCCQCLANKDVLNDFLARGSNAARNLAISLIGGVKV